MYVGRDPPIQYIIPAIRVIYYALLLDSSLISALAGSAAIRAVRSCFIKDQQTPTPSLFDNGWWI
jgi:hypothetical protein